MIRRHRAALVLMHMRGKPRTMHRGPFASDVMKDVAIGLREAIGRATRAGIAKNRILIDPGIGFGKRYAQNFEVLRHLPELARLGYPLVVGTSKKVFVGWALASKGTPWPADQRGWGTATTHHLRQYWAGAHIVRAHDVAETVQVARVADAIARAR